MSLEWWQELLIGLIPVYALFLFLILSPWVFYFERSGSARACLRTRRFIESGSFGLVTYLTGNIGVGKTTCGSGITNTLALIKSDQANVRMEEIRTIFSDIDFNEINSFIQYAFFELHYLNSNALLNYLLDQSEDLRKKIEGQYMNTSLYPVSKVSLFRDYIEAYLASIRNNYVYANRRGFYCWPTNNWAINYLPSMIDVKDRYLDHDYSLLRYSVIFEDEKVLSGKVSTSYRQVADQEGGADTFLRLIRHFGKGTMHYISTSQDFERVVKSERELATGIFQIEKRSERNTVSLSSIFNDILLDLVVRFQFFYLGIAQSYSEAKREKWERRSKQIEELDLDPLPEVEEKIKIYSQQPVLKESKIRSMISSLQFRQKKDFADGFIGYKGLYYTNADDVGKKQSECSSQCFKLEMVFPIAWCYGSIDTYAFSIIHDVLVNESEDNSYSEVDFTSTAIPDFARYGAFSFAEAVLSKKSKRNPSKAEVYDDLN